MGYDRERATPSDAAHDAAASFDALYEAAADGLDLGDLTVLTRALPFIQYVMETADKGEAVSRGIQVMSMVERDNALLDEAID